MRTENWVCFSEESVRGSGSPVVFRAVLDFPWGGTPMPKGCDLCVLRAHRELSIHTCIIR